MSIDTQMSLCRELAGRAWCTKETTNIEMDVILAEAFAQILHEEIYKKCHLGVATTRELLAELTARIEIDGQLDYKTVGED
jgi:hypothetical protein